MNDLLDLRLSVGVAGFFEETTQKNVKLQISKILHEIKLRAADYSSEKYGFSATEPTLDLYTAPSFIDSNWAKVKQEKNITLNLIAETKDEQLMERYHADTMVGLGLQAKRLGTMDTMIDWVMNQVDLFLIVWNGDENEQNGLLWNIVKECQRDGVVCIWIDSRDGTSVNYYDGTCFEPYNYQKVREFMKDRYDYELAEEQTKGKEIFGRFLWKKVYHNFMNRFNEKSTVEYICKDTMLNEGYKLDTTKVLAHNYHMLLNFYNKYDSEAVQYSKRYRESIYFRSILPLLAAIFLTSGFYIAPVLTYSIPLSGIINVLTIVSGVGFLVHALMNCYGYYMENHPTVRQDSTKFLESRYIAEYLRTLLHFYSFGIPVKHIELKKQKYGYHGTVSKRVSARIKNIIRSQMPVDVSIDQIRIHRILESLNQMLDDQIDYHQQTSKRYGRISNHLKKCAKIAFWIGFSIVVARGLLQFSFIYVHFEGMRNGITLDKFISSSANLLALLLPAWASYFSTKLNLNNYEALCAHSEKVETEQQNLKKELAALADQESISFEQVFDLSEEILMNQIGELDYWYTQMASKRVTRL